MPTTKKATKKAKKKVKKKIGRPRKTKAQKEADRLATNELQRARRDGLRKLRKAALKGAAAGKKLAASTLKKKGKPGAKAFRPTDEQREQVAMMSALGMRHDEMALLTTNPITGDAITAKTLLAHFSREIENGPLMAGLEVGRSIYRRAIDDKHPQSTTNAIWYSKCRLGWTERTVVAIESKSGVLLIPAAATPEDWIKAAEARAAEATEPGAKEA